MCKGVLGVGDPYHARESDVADISRPKRARGWMLIVSLVSSLTDLFLTRSLTFGGQPPAELQMCYILFPFFLNNGFNGATKDVQSLGYFYN